MPDEPSSPQTRGRTVHGEAANAGHRVLAPDDAEVEAYLEQALHAPPSQRAADVPSEPDTVVMYGDLAVIARPGADARRPELIQTVRGVGYRFRNR